MNCEQRQHLRRTIPLLTYLKQKGWKPTAYSESDEVCGVCPLHRDSRPSFYVNRRKDVFYCHGCGQGGDVIRLAELLHGLNFRAALAALMGQDANRQRLWSDACDFYRHQLRYSIDAQSYLRSRGIEDQEIIDRMRIGYARAQREELPKLSPEMGPSIFGVREGAGNGVDWPSRRWSRRGDGGTGCATQPWSSAGRALSL